MILGRTPAGLIKIKTDGGLRAVNCACCSTPCEITQAQFDTIRYGFTTNIVSVGVGIGGAVPVPANIYGSMQNPEKDRLEILGELFYQEDHTISTSGPFNCIIDEFYPVTYTQFDVEGLRISCYYQAWIPNDTTIAPTYFLYPAQGEQGGAYYYRQENSDCSRWVYTDQKRSYPICGEALYKFLCEGAPWSPWQD